MLVHLAIHTPMQEHVDDMIASMERFAAAGRSQAGLQNCSASPSTVACQTRRGTPRPQHAQWTTRSDK